MDGAPTQQFAAPDGLLRIEDTLDSDGEIALPEGTTLISLIERNIASVGDTVAFRYLDFAGTGDPQVREWTWSHLGVRLAAIAARLQQLAGAGERVAVLAPQGLDYVAGFFAAIKAGTIAVPLFAPELPGHTERLGTALADCTPSVVVTTAGARAGVEAFVDRLPSARRPRLLVIDEIPDAARHDFTPVVLEVDAVSHLQYTSGATRPPVGVEVTHRAVGTNLVQMILSIDLLNRNTHGVSWLPLYHDMGLSMLGFPTVYGGHSTLMSPAAFIRRPQRWIQALSAGSREGQVVTAAPNLAYELTAQRGLPGPDERIDLANVVMIIGSEPVSMEAISTFTKAFAPYGLARTAIKPSYGIAEATLMIATTAPSAEAHAVYFDRDQLGAGRAVPVAADAPEAVIQVSCGQLARSLRGVIVDPQTGDELPDGRIGEIWLHGDNVARGYWGRPEESRAAFEAVLHTRLSHGGHAGDVPAGAHWLRTGDLGVYLDGELFVTGRLADLVRLDGRDHYPHDIETTVADASSMARRGYVVAFTTPIAHGDAGLVIVAERARGTGRADPQPAIEAIGAAVTRVHGLTVADVRFVQAGAIPRTTSGKLARRACRDAYRDGAL
ncbi:AMP-binding protein [Mycolicibacillus parakoreensis]|uniref:Fatty acyl-AMP ligase n=1 Tax=Mycolicibacillus parakoreensis TaxID=1069221 RepID=A0ABY3U610_9MYCO|nr:fatty acyl-AMP ligase [Mycolicibacillus parakoreensis]MCV7317485.1 AMP-binding protein [Mycolicibacillus parakoreensis]ULN54202.1 fatty acyl-AMP ligase [Mycolicibacillus parakoreensis]